VLHCELEFSGLSHNNPNVDGGSRFHDGIVLFLGACGNEFIDFPRLDVASGSLMGSGDHFLTFQVLLRSADRKVMCRCAFRMEKSFRIPAEIRKDNRERQLGRMSFSRITRETRVRRSRALNRFQGFGVPAKESATERVFFPCSAAQLEHEIAWVGVLRKSVGNQAGGTRKLDSEGSATMAFGPRNVA
jgi:hypothetical protein